jgi:predicted metalloprotease
MKWTRGTRSKHVEDARGNRVTMGKLGAGGLVLVLIGVVAQQFLGVDIIGQLGIGQGGGGKEEQGPPPDPKNDPDAETIDFIHFIVEDLHTTWSEIFQKAGKTYRPATLKVFREGTTSKCGFGTSSIGPFYCPGDEKAYIDLSFYKLLEERFGAPGRFAQAYVVAHEWGHHIQNVLGYEDTMREAQKRDPERKNELSVRFELQADCLAGVWGHSTQKRNLLESGDVEAGLKAAAAIGDDTLQKQSGGQVSPESWTHGSSEQRMKWLRRGLESGTIDSCDTSGPL